MAREIRVLVVCGSGIATSSLAQQKIEQIAKEAGIRIRVKKGTIGNIQALQQGADVVFTTANYLLPLEKPHLSVFGLVTGINRAETARSVKELLQEVEGPGK